MNGHGEDRPFCVFLSWLVREGYPMVSHNIPTVLGFRIFYTPSVLKSFQSFGFVKKTIEQVYSSYHYGTSLSIFFQHHISMLFLHVGGFRAVNPSWKDLATASGLLGHLLARGFGDFDQLR